MKSIRFTLLTGCLVAIMGLASTLQAANRPNIVLVLADDMGYDVVHALNPKSRIATPHIDRLIRQGICFTDAHSGSAVCSPTRYGILTGRYSWRSKLKQGIVGQWQPPLIEPQRLTVGGMLQELGYHTACIGKWHLGWNWPDAEGNPTSVANKVDFTRPITGGPVETGFDYYFGDDVPNWPPYVFIENDRTQGIPSTVKPKTMFGSPGPMLPGWKLDAVMPEITSRAVDYIGRRAQQGQPFFLYFPLTSPHTPIAPSPEFLGKSGISKYADYVMETDWAVGQVMQALNRHGIAEETLLIFTADNGTSPQCRFEELESKGVDLRYHFRGNKADIYEGGHRVPFVARWPGVIAPATECSEVICLTDFMATVADVTGYELPVTAAEDSRSLLPLLKGTRPDRPLHAAVVHHSASGLFALRQGWWKLEFCRGSGGWSHPTEREARQQGLPTMQLYDLQQDPKEATNRYASNQARIEQLTAILRKIVTSGRSTPGPPQANADPTWWRQLPWEKPPE
jgi:arylsulfatase A